MKVGERFTHRSHHSNRAPFQLSKNDGEQSYQKSRHGGNAKCCMSTQSAKDYSSCSFQEGKIQTHGVLIQKMRCFTHNPCGYKASLCNFEPVGSVPKSIPKKGSTVAWHAPVQYLLEASWEHPSIKVFSIDSIAYKHKNIKTTQLHALALQPFPCMCHSTYTLSVRHEVARLPVSKLNVYHLLVCWHPQDNTLFNNIYTTQFISATCNRPRDCTERLRKYFNSPTSHRTAEQEHEDT